MGGKVVNLEKVELKRVKKYLEKELSEAWNIRVRDNEIVAKYEDAYDIETISIEVEVRPFNYVVYKVYCEHARKDDEIITCDSCHAQDCDECPLFEELKEDDGEKTDRKKLDEYVQREIERHLNKQRFELRAFVGYINVAPCIVERECYLDIPHVHLYRGVKIYAELNHIDLVKALITLRFFLYSLVNTS